MTFILPNGEKYTPIEIISFNHYDIVQYKGVTYMVNYTIHNYDTKNIEVYLMEDLRNG